MNRSANISKKISLSLLSQIINYFYPLITIFLCSRRFNTNEIASLVLYQAIIQYVILLQDYGFTIYSSRLIAAHPSIYEKREIIKTTQTCRLLISLFMLSLVSGSLFFQHSPNTIQLVLIEIIIGNLIFPQWRFIGEEKFHIYNSIMSSAKFIVLIIISLLIQKISFATLLKLFFSYQLLSALIHIMIYRDLANLDFSVAHYGKVIHYLKNSLYPFLTICSASIYLFGGTIISKGVFSNEFVISYSISEKIARALASYPQIKSLTHYPTLVKSSSTFNIQKIFSLIWNKNNLLEGIGLYSLSLLGTFIYIKYVLHSLELSIFPIIILSSISPIILISSILNNIIQSTGHFRKQFIFTIIGAITFITICAIAFIFHSQTSICFAVPITEITIFILLFNEIKKIYR